jgi:hypothetical protein
MITISYDIDTMDIPIENGKFLLNELPDNQNGALLLYTRNTDLNNPLRGVGIGNQVNSNEQDLSVAVGNWQRQAQEDGAKTAVATLYSEYNKDLKKNESKVFYQISYSV